MPQARVRLDLVQLRTRVLGPLAVLPFQLMHHCDQFRLVLGAQRLEGRFVLPFLEDGHHCHQVAEPAALSILPAEGLLFRLQRFSRTDCDNSPALS